MLVEQFLELTRKKIQKREDNCVSLTILNPNELKENLIWSVKETGVRCSIGTRESIEPTDRSLCASETFHRLQPDLAENPNHQQRDKQI